MPAQSYAISGTVYDTDGTTALVNARVNVWDVTQTCWLKSANVGITDESGNFVVDLQHLSRTYANNDKLQIVAYTLDGTRVSTEARHTVNTGIGSYECNLYMHDGQLYTGTCRLKAFFASVTATTKALKMDLYDRTNDKRIIQIVCPASNAVSFESSSHKGILFSGGICRVMSVEDAGLQVVIKIDDTR